MDKQVKIVGKHSRNCAGVRLTKEGSWSSPWGPLAFGDYGAPTINTWRKYGKNGRRLLTWMRFVCNDASCKAELHVESKLILRTAIKAKP